MCNSNSRVSCIYTLSSITASSVNINSKIILIYNDINIFNFR